MLPASEYIALPGSDPPHQIIRTVEVQRSCRPAFVGLLAVVGVMCLVAVLGSDGASPSAVSESLSSPLGRAEPSDGIFAAMKKAHDALKQQRYSLANPIAADLPPEMSESMNFSSDPCVNFYEYVCGNWVKKTEIPPDRGAWSRTWDSVEALVRKEMKSLVTEKWEADSQFAKLNTWYESCMDTSRIETLGAEPLHPMLLRIEGIETPEDFQDVLTDLIVLNSPTFLQFAVNVGYRDKNHNLLFITAAGLTMPNPDWYNVTFPDTGELQRVGQQSLTTDPNAEHATDREHVRSYMQRINELAGAAPGNASAWANQTLAAETLLAQWQLDEPPFADALGPEPISLSELEERYPNLPWRRVLDKMAAACEGYGYACNKRLLADDKVIVMGSPLFFDKLSAALADEEMMERYWKPLLRSHYIYSLAQVLNQEFLLANLELQQFLEGVSKLKPREDKCIDATTDGLSALADMAFVEKFFGNASWSEGTTLLEHIKAEFVLNLEHVTWMDNETHAEALAKADRMRLNLGGPEGYKVLAYPVSAQSYFNNSVHAVMCRQLRQFMDVGETPDAEAWKFAASTVNAWYDNGANALYIPAGIMQPPFFSPHVPQAQNFGAIGSVMAHEMTHGFDDTGAFFDANREMRNWWSKPSAERFAVRANCIRMLYSSLAIAGEAVKGAATMGENIADFGGLKIAYKAFLSWFHERYDKEAPMLEKQMVFIAFGQNWCDKEHASTQRYLVESDEHAPSVFRTNAVVSQNSDFAQVFSCPLGSPMNPVDKCVMWKQVPMADGSEELKQLSPLQQLESSSPPRPPSSSNIASASFH